MNIQKLCYLFVCHIFMFSFRTYLKFEVVLNDMFMLHR